MPSQGNASVLTHNPTKCPLCDLTYCVYASPQKATVRSENEVWHHYTMGWTPCPLCKKQGVVAPVLAAAFRLLFDVDKHPSYCDVAALELEFRELGHRGPIGGL